jgi:glycosyltransferase involved in cell wall biosynthesis
MKVLFIARSTLFTVFGGDTVQIESTAKYLLQLDVRVDIRLCNEKIDYASYDLIHFFNIIRPADILKHIRKSQKPFVVSTIFVDFAEYEKRNRTGLFKVVTSVFSSDQLEYLKSIARWVRNGERTQSLEYLWKGHRNAVRNIAGKAALLLPNSQNEYQRFSKHYNISCAYRVIYNGIDPDVFSPKKPSQLRSEKLVLCVARIEGKKNQLNLIKALNNTEYKLYLIGKPAPNHLEYYEECKRIAGNNIHFIGFQPQEELTKYYQEAKVHVLPSWNETCGLSSLEAAYNGCNIVITDKGDTLEYYGEHAWYCDPANISSIFEAVDKAAKAPCNNTDLLRKIGELYNWQKAALETKEAYKSVLRPEKRQAKTFAETKDAR